MGTCLFAKALLSNGSCIFVYVAVVAQQRVYMLQYIFDVDPFDPSLKYLLFLSEDQL
jgi:hypothetical protein